MKSSTGSLSDKRSPEVEAAIRRRAQELFEQRGRAPGHDLEDWLQAETEIARQSTPRTARIVVRVEGATYVGEYDPQHCGGYHRGEFSPGAPLRVRFQDDRMYITRPNGSELETRVSGKS